MEFRSDSFELSLEPFVASATKRDPKRNPSNYGAFGRWLSIDLTATTHTDISLHPQMIQSTKCCDPHTFVHKYVLLSIEVREESNNKTCLNRIGQPGLESLDCFNFVSCRACIHLETVDLITDLIHYLSVSGSNLAFTSRAN